MSFARGIWWIFLFVMHRQCHLSISPWEALKVRDNMDEVALEMDVWLDPAVPLIDIHFSWTGNYSNGSMSNISAGNSSDHPYPYYQHSPPVAASLILVYLFIFLLCMVGNGLVCLIVVKNRRMRTVTNLFILNLAVSNLLVGIFCIPTTLVDNLITGNTTLTDTLTEREWEFSSIWIDVLSV